MKRPEDNHGAGDRNSRYTMLMSPTVMPTGDSPPRHGVRRACQGTHSA